MAMTWFKLDNTADLEGTDLAILNTAARHLIRFYNLSPTNANLSLVRQTYRAGMSAKVLIEAVEDIRHVDRRMVG